MSSSWYPIRCSLEMGRYPWLRQSVRHGDEFETQAKKGGGHGWERMIPSKVMEGGVDCLEKIATGGHVSQDLPCIHVSEEV
jgi:hypothetical protein